MSSNTSGIQSVGKFQYNPYPMSGYYSADFDNIDLDYSTYPMMGAGMGMNGSIFGNNIGLGAMPYMGAGGIVGGYNPQDYFNQMKQYQQFYNQYNIDQCKMQRNADLQINGSMESVTEAAEHLKDKISRNEQDQIKVAYQKFLQAVRNAYGQGNDEDMNSRAATLYKQITGKSLFEDLRDNGHGSFMQGIIQTMTFGTYAKKSAEDNVAEISGQEVATTEKAVQNVGRVAGGVGVAAVVTGALKGLTKLSTGKAGIIGSIVGIAATALAFMTGKVTN